MPTYGTHTPDVPYEPSSVMAWGPRGDQNFKSYNDQIYEQRCKATKTSHNWNSINLRTEDNYEVRLDDADSTYEPNVKNFAPRPKVWKKDMYESYGAK